MHRSVRPVWPFTKSLAEQQNRVQRQMLAYFVKIERLPLEGLDAYSRRRMRQIATFARQQGAWGTEHARRLISWAEHLQRPLNSTSLASQLFLWHGPDWLQARRLESGAMRLQTRLVSGFLQKRWDESIEDARRYVVGT